MTTLRNTLAAASLLVLAGFVQAQQAPDANKPNPSAATSTGTSTSQSEMNKGVPGVDVNTGSKASNGVVSGTVDKNTDSSNVTNNTSTSGTSDANTTNDTNTNTRAARADRG